MTTTEFAAKAFDAVVALFGRQLAATLPAQPPATELTRSALRAVEDDFVLPIVIHVDEVSLPALSVAVGDAPALDTGELGTTHAQDHARSDRRRPVALRDTVSSGQRWLRDPRG